MDYLATRRFSTKLPSPTKFPERSGLAPVSPALVLVRTGNLIKTLCALLN